jgi:hypothetical protein
MLSDTERRVMAQEVQAAQRILSAPDRHTSTELAYAQARLDEVLTTLSADATERLTALFQAVVTAVQPVLTSTVAALKDWYQSLEEWAGEHGTTAEALITASDKAMDKALLEAAHRATDEGEA